MAVAQSESVVYGVYATLLPELDPKPTPRPESNTGPLNSAPDPALLTPDSDDPSLNELTTLAAVLCGAEFAYIGLVATSPTGPTHLHFKSRQGFTAPSQPLVETACQWTIESAAPLLISDAAFDPRFAPRGPRVIALPGAVPCLSYAGVPLVDASQETFGTLAVLSAQSGRFKQEHLRVLEILGRQIATRFELYNRIAAQEQALSARMRTEQALAVERSFVSVTLDSIPALIAVLDTAGRIVRLNDPCMQLTGLSLAGAVGRQFGEEVLDDVDRAWTAAKLREAAEGRISGPHETSWRKRGIRSRRVSWTLRPLTGPGDGDGVQYLIVTGHDVTDRRDAERALLSSENRLNHVVQNSLGFLFTCSLEGRLTSLNAFTAETLGYCIADLSGRQVADFLDSVSAAQFRDALGRLESGVEWQGVLRVRRSDGGYRHIAFRSRRMQLPDKPPFVLNHGMDVTEKHEAEQALRIETRQRELILESVGDGIFGIDLDGRLTFINEAASQMLDYKPEQFAGLTIHDLINHPHADASTDSNIPDSDPAWQRISSPILLAMRRREQIRMSDEVFLRSNGDPVPVEYSASPLLEDGQVSGMVVAFQDVSERRRLDRMKDEFITTVSHDLRTPLTSLRAALDLMTSPTLENKPDKQRQMADMALTNCNRLVGLVNTILDFERLQEEPASAEPAARQAEGAVSNVR